MSGTPTSRDDPRARVTFDVRGVEVQAFVWRRGASWRAAVPVGRREVVVMDAVDCDDALARAREGILGDADLARALGVAPERRWSVNPYWNGR